MTITTEQLKKEQKVNHALTQLRQAAINRDNAQVTLKSAALAYAAESGETFIGDSLFGGNLLPDPEPAPAALPVDKAAPALPAGGDKAGPV